jgi:hypothetical protein
VLEVATNLKQLGVLKAPVVRPPAYGLENASPLSLASNPLPALNYLRFDLTGPPKPLRLKAEDLAPHDLTGENCVHTDFYGITGEFVHPGHLSLQRVQIGTSSLVVQEASSRGDHFDQGFL